MLGVEGEQARIELGETGAAGRAGALDGEHLHLGLLRGRVEIEHVHQALAQIQRLDDIALQRVGVVLLHVDLRHRQLDGVFLEAVEARPLVGGEHFAVDAQMFVAARVGPLGEFGVVTLARHHQRRQQQDAAALVLFQQALGDGLRRLRLDGHVAGGTELRAQLLTYSRRRK